MSSFCKTKYFSVLLFISAFFWQSCKGQSVTIANDADGIGNLQTVSINAAESNFDPDLTLVSSNSCGWRVNVQNAPNGAVFQIRRSEMTGPPRLQNAISVSVQDGGSEVSFVPSSGYESGVKLPDISTSYETLGWVKNNGNARFRVKLSVFSKSKNGSGSVSGTLSIIGALLP